MSLTPTSLTRSYWAARRSVLGAFWDIDFLIFDQILSRQKSSTVTGDLLEIGALYGKSAIVLGLHAARAETVIVCDIFETAGANDANNLENAVSYPGLSRAAFEANYRRWVQRPARIVQELSGQIRSHVVDNSIRFAHIDGGHHYDVVSDDLENTKQLLNSAGILALDDFRAIHSPGVAAATWEAVANRGLIPFCATEQKLYASWDSASASAMTAHLAGWAKGQRAVNAGLQDVAGQELLVIQNPLGTSVHERIRRLVPPAVIGALREPAKPYLGRPL